MSKRVKRIRALRDAPRRNASWEVSRFKVAQDKDPMCAQNLWAIATVLLCTAVLCTSVLCIAVKQFLFYRVLHTLRVKEQGQGLIIVSRVRRRDMARSFD